MRSRLAQWTAVTACAGAFALGNLAAAVEPTPGNQAVPTQTVRASKLVGLHVKNPAGERLGTVDDLVLNLATGKTAYVAMGVGGVLGIGEKLFAVPFSALKVEHEKDEMVFVLDTTKEKLESSPGFDKKHWPDFADPKWTKQIDDFYRQAGQPRPVTESLAK